MGAVRPPKRCLLFAGLLSNDEDLLRRTVRLLSGIFGDVLQTSRLWPFDQTDYYQVEMGGDLQRQFVAFELLIRPGQLPNIKRKTNALERRIADDCALPDGFRAVNIDPGYLTLSKLVLATTKDYSHRLYLDQGIYAEVTLHYESGTWHPWPWTYPDYADGWYTSFFVELREHLKQKLSEPNNPEPTA